MLWKFGVSWMVEVMRTVGCGTIGLDISTPHHCMNLFARIRELSSGLSNGFCAPYHARMCYSTQRDWFDLWIVFHLPYPESSSLSTIFVTYGLVLLKESLMQPQ